MADSPPRAMAPPHILLSLNQDVLREVLAHLLLDTPRTLHRTSILQTCSLLHELGLPLLYRVVNLVKIEDDLTLLKKLEALFSEGGLLTEQGGRGKLVVELKAGHPWKRLHPTFVREDALRWQGGIDCQYQRIRPVLNLPNCSSLTLPSSFSYHNDALSTLLTRIAAQLPLRNITITTEANRPGEAACQLNLTAFDPFLASSGPHRRLEKVLLDGAIFYKRHPQGGRRLSVRNWSFEVLVVKLHLSLPKSADDPEEVSNLFFEPDSETEKDLFLKDTERVELRVAGPLADEFDKGFREEFGKREARGLSAFARRIGSLIVLVGEDGEERRLVE